MYRNTGQFAVTAAQLPALIALHGAVDQCVVLAQIGWFFGTPSRFQVGRRSDQHPRVDPKVGRPECGVGEFAQTYRHIHALFDQVDIAILAIEFDLQMGIHSHEFQHQRGHDASPKSHR